MADFYYNVRGAETELDKLMLLLLWHGDPRLKLSSTPEPVLIRKEAAYCNRISGKNSLEHVFCLAGTRNREVAFTCLVNEQGLIIERVLCGHIGTCGNCYWDSYGWVDTSGKYHWRKSRLLEKSLQEAKRDNLKVMLGHTHPPNYGPVCSNIYYWDDNPYGEDYLMTLWRMRCYPKLISRFHMIMTPNE